MKTQYLPLKNDLEKTQLSVKINQLQESREEVQKYELMTTTQYREQMELLLMILQDIAQKVK